MYHAYKYCYDEIKIHILAFAELTYEGLSEDFREPPCVLSKSEF